MKAFRSFADGGGLTALGFLVVIVVSVVVSVGIVVGCDAAANGNNALEETRARVESQNNRREAAALMCLQSVTFKGHEYIVYDRNSEAGGICHSASCPCHRGRRDD